MTCHTRAIFLVILLDFNEKSYLICSMMIFSVNESTRSGNPAISKRAKWRETTNVRRKLIKDRHLATSSLT